jgi:hypothetical protein
MDKRGLRAPAAAACAVLLAASGGCIKRPQMKVLISMLGQQEAFFRNEVAPEFQKSEKVKLEILHYSTDSITQTIGRYPGQVGLVKIPFDKSRALMSEEYLKPIDSFLTEEQMKEFRETFLLTSLGSADGKQYLIPRKFETRLHVYSASMVADAVGQWRGRREAIDSEVKQINGYGLPATYTLEPYPGEWDYFDIFVAGWIWAHTEYGGKTVGRVAHRGRRYSGTSLGLIDKVFQCGGDSTAVLSMNHDAVTEMFFWEAVFASYGIYNKRMWEEEWSGTSIWEGIADGEVFSSQMTQIDCFFIHGTGTDSLFGFMETPEDMGVATMPRGVSMMVDEGGDPLWTGKKSITTGGWWWGIPADAPMPEKSYALARFITGTQVQMQEANRFGMIPVRKDILSDMQIMFGGGWITRVYDVSLQQLMENQYTIIPGNTHFNEIAELYLDAWYDIVVNKNWSASEGRPDRTYIAQVLKEQYVPKAAAILR